MDEWKSVDEILDFAIANEQEAADFYTGLAATVTRAWMKEVFEGFAKEEAGHKRKLIAIRDGKLIPPSANKVVQDLKIADYAVDVEAGPEIDYQEALIVAMKKEKAAFRLYTDLASNVDDANVKDTFLMLAQEEAKHKLRFEIEYDEYVLTEN
jgi:rubrerythrin